MGRAEITAHHKNHSNHSSKMPTPLHHSEHPPNPLTLREGGRFLVTLGMTAKRGEKILKICVIGGCTGRNFVALYEL